MDRADYRDLTTDDDNRREVLRFGLLHRRPQPVPPSAQPAAEAPPLVVTDLREMDEAAFRGLDLEDFDAPVPPLAGWQ